jgi:hypothetical protein
MKRICAAAALALLVGCQESDGGWDSSIYDHDGDTASADTGEAADPPDGDADGPGGFCVGLSDATWCDGDDLVTCSGGVEAGRETCPEGCWPEPGDTPDHCLEDTVCIDEPSPVSPDPPIEVCNYMDWKMSVDGHYLISQFGTTNDGTTLGRTTSCGFLQDHYDAHGCRYDARTGSCLAGDHDIPWIHGHVDWDYDTMIAQVDEYAGGDVPYPEYFYVACAQRFGCGSLLRVTNTENGRCVVAYVEDGGPGATYEDAGYGGRRILDSSPAIVRTLGVTALGWLHSTMMYVEWGLPGDVPGQACTRCESRPAAYGYTWGGSPYDVNHMMTLECREDVCGDGTCGPDEDHDSCPEDCPTCEPVPRDGRIVDQTDPCYTPGGTPSYWHTEPDGYGGSLMWTHTTDSSGADNYGLWRLELAESGSYTLEVYTDATWAQSRQADYQIVHAGSTDHQVVDQTAVDGWSLVGTYGFAAGGGQSVRLDDNTGEPYSGLTRIVFDAIRLTRVGP